MKRLGRLVVILLMVLSIWCVTEVFAGNDTRGGVVSFDAESFSVYGVVYTIQYGEFSYELLGNQEVFLSELLDVLQTGIAIDEVDEVTSSGNGLLLVKEEDDYIIKLLGEEINTEEEDPELPEGEGESASLTVKTVAGRSITISLSPTGLRELDLDGAIIKAADGMYLPVEAEGHSFLQEEAEETIKAVEEFIANAVPTEEKEITPVGEEQEEAPSSVGDEEQEVPSPVGDEKQGEEAPSSAGNEEKGEANNRSYLVYEIGLENVNLDDYESGFEVSINLPDGIHGKDFRLYHIHEGEVKEVEDLVVGDGEMSFTTRDFSEFVLSYTVDFHWLVDGQEFTFSIPGGGFVSFKELVKILGIVNEKDTESFIDEVEDVSFSSPELVWVGKVDEDITVAKLKEENGLICEYIHQLPRNTSAIQEIRVVL